jgi:hypothetical protein
MVVMAAQVNPSAAAAQGAFFPAQAARAQAAA